MEMSFSVSAITKYELMFGQICNLGLRLPNNHGWITNWKPVDGVDYVGHFMSPRFLMCKDTVKNWFRFNSHIAKSVRRRYININWGATVAVHVRLQDFVSLYNYYNPRGSYYRQAIELLDPSGVKKVALFSDQPEVAIALLQDLKRPLIRVEGNSAIEDMYLMSSCSAIVTAASSFSWWGAFLGCGAVVCPEQGFLRPGAPVTAVDPYPDDWVRLDAGLRWLDHTTVRMICLGRSACWRQVSKACPPPLIRATGNFVRYVVFNRATQGAYMAIRQTMLDALNHLLHPLSLDLASLWGRDHQIRVMREAAISGQAAATSAFAGYLKTVEESSPELRAKFTSTDFLESLLEREPVKWLAETILMLPSAPDSLLDRFFRYYANNYEKGISQWSQDIFAMFAFHKNRGGRYLEVGGANGITHSNTLSLRDFWLVGSLSRTTSAAVSITETVSRKITMMCTSLP
jgi:hypothetical protein